MRMVIAGFAALLAGALPGGAFAETVQDEIQDDEQPGSEVEVDIGRGQVEIGREPSRNPPRELMAPPVEIEGQTLDVPNDPDTPIANDPVDAELPGEGPESLSGPDDDDPLPE